MAAEVISNLAIAANSLIVDIGSNDGTLLSAFGRLGMRVVGVEPTGIARYAIENGIDTIQSIFNKEVAMQIVESNGPADVVTATNVFAHMASLGDMLEGLELLLGKNGHFVLENHYLAPIMERLQFDTIYHERNE